MPKTKPTLGYPSRTEAALALRAEGLSEKAVAERLGVKRSGVAGLLQKARARDLAPPRKSDGNYDTKLARREGILLATEAGRIEHRETSHCAVRVVEIRLGEDAFGKLVELARRTRQTPSALAAGLVLAGMEGK